MHLGGGVFKGELNGVMQTVHFIKKGKQFSLGAIKNEKNVVNESLPKKDTVA